MTPIKKIHIIINPAAGSEEPILSYLNKAFIDTPIDWTVSVTHKEGEVFEIASRLLARSNPETADSDTPTRPDEQAHPGAPDHPDAIAIYGGDGSIMEAARALHASDMPLAIIPGGTANVMAKELGIPLDSRDAIALLTSQNITTRKIDMGLVNGCPFLIRINLGILATMITDTTEELKDRWGQWAYGITAFHNLPQEAGLFHLNIDGREFTQEAAALTITNAGNIGKKGYSFLPDISVSDGWLDVIALDKADMLSLLKITGDMLFQKDSAVLKHWRAKEVTIRSDQEMTFLRDDTEEKAQQLKITVAPATLNVLVPKNPKNEA